MPEPAGPLESFFDRMRGRAPGGPILCGFDFPIGVPRGFAERAGISEFAPMLQCFGAGKWSEFYKLAERPEEISLTRPFYPRAPGGKRVQHLLDGLGLASPLDLLRRCDHATESRGRACATFWTLGANQVGRAAIAGWRDLLAPALRAESIALWPFDGELPELLDGDRIVVAETYPAEAYGHIGMARGFGKRTQEGRRQQARAIHYWCERTCTELSDELAGMVLDGFGPAPNADDAFDAVAGLLGLIDLFAASPRQLLPDDQCVSRVEGWILGMAPPSH